MIRLPTSKNWLNEVAEFDEPFETIGAGPGPTNETSRGFSGHSSQKRLPVVIVSYTANAAPNTKNAHKHIQTLAEDRQIKILDDTWIDSGSSWFSAIRGVLLDCPLLILVIDSYFVDSQWSKKEEVQFLIEEVKRRGTVVVSVVTQDCDLRSVPSIFERLSDPTVHQQARQQLSKESEQALETFERICTFHLQRSPVKHQQNGQPQTRLFFKPEKTTLFGRNAELRLLDEVWEKQNARILCLEGGGGIGKSSCVARWLYEMSNDQYRGASQVFTWSFYSQTGGHKVRSAAFFLYHALEFFGGDAAAALASVAPYEAARLLAEYLLHGKVLLVLDGFEPFQNEHEISIDPALQTFFDTYRIGNTGLCVITSRRNISVLFENSASARVKRLETSASRAMLRCSGGIGFDSDLDNTARDLGGSPLALNLIVPHLRSRNNGIDSRQVLPETFAGRSEATTNALRILAAVAKTLRSRAEFEVLRILGLFDRPAKFSELQEIQAGPPLPGLTGQIHEFSASRMLSILGRLSELNVLSISSEGDGRVVDSHPVVREYLSHDLKQEASESWEQGHLRLATSLCRRSAEFPDTLDELENLYESVTHFCLARRYHQAFKEIYWKRIQRQNLKYASNHLGVVSLDLATLELFFLKRWTELVPIKDIESNWRIFQLTARQLWHLGRLRDAQTCLENAMKLADHNQLYYFAARSARRLAEVHLAAGDLLSAKKCGTQAIKFSELCRNDRERAHARFDSLVTVASILNQMGEKSPIEALVREAEFIRKSNPGLVLLNYTWGFWYCDLISDNPSIADLLQCALQSFDAVIQVGPSKADLAKGTLLTQGLAPISAAIVKSNDAASQGATLKALNRGIDKLRASAQLPHLAFGLLIRARVQRELCQLDRAEDDLDEAKRIIDGSGMSLRKAEWYLENIQLLIARKRFGAAVSVVSDAKKLMKEIHYKRRISDLNELDQFISKNRRFTNLWKIQNLVDKQL